MTAAELSRLAAEVGIDVVGAAPAAPYEDTERHILERRERGLFAGMRFTMARPEISCHPERLLDGARTVVSAALCYYVPGPDPRIDEGRLPRYAWRDHYADLRKRLTDLGERLGGSYRVLVDSNDHVDREAAVRAGVAFYGKNTLAITRRFGSWVVLGTLVTDVEVEPTPELALDCGACRLCIDACPTGALDEPGVVDSTRCLSYWTQAPEPIPEEFRSSPTPYTAATSARRSARGTAASNGGERPSRRRRMRHRSSRCETGSQGTKSLSRPSSIGCTSPGTRAGGSDATRWLRPGTWAAAT
jgi:epoxyqueuosine reductase